MKPAPIFATLVPRAQAGEKAAADQLMTAFYAWSIAEARKILRDDDDAADVAVEFWAALLHGDRPRIRQFAPVAGDFGGFFSWMALCLKRAALDAVRRRRLPLEYGDDAPEAEVDCTALETVATAETTARMIGRLTAREREVFELMLAGFETREICLATDDLSEKHVRRIRAQVRAVARDVLGDGSC